jgi:hypothetical protein
MREVKVAEAFRKAMDLTLHGAGRVALGGWGRAQRSVVRLRANRIGISALRPVATTRALSPDAPPQAIQPSLGCQVARRQDGARGARRTQLLAAPFASRWR